MTAQAQPAFGLTVSQNAYLFAGETEMHAVLTVTAQGLDDLTGGEVPDAAEVIAIDCSGSMYSPPTKLRAAQEATSAAIDALRDGVFFAVVEGTHTARMVYPRDGLVAASTRTRTAAKRAVRRLTANGGTAMGSWLRLANELLDAHPAAVRHVLLLTDGQNVHETPEQLGEVLAECSGRFVCDARGVGDGWEPEELLRIVAALNGTADAVREEAELAADFTAIMRAAMRKVVPELLIRIETPPFASVRFLRQTYPTQTDLTALGTSDGPRTTLYPTGSWGEESRDFHVCLDLRPDGLELLEYQVAEVGLVPVRAGAGLADAVTGAEQPIVAQWTEDTVLSSVMDSRVAHATNQAELGRAVMAGCEAYDAGDTGLAALEWGKAVALASAQRNEKVLARLHRLVDVVGDPARGEVRVRTDLRELDLKLSELSRSHGTRGPGDERVEAVAPPPAGPDRTCARCGHVSPSGAKFCESCGTKLGTSA